MTVTITQDTANAKVTITANGLGAANFATVERSINQVVWTTVRGGTQVALTAGAFVTPLDDYEFAPGVVNFYRVRGIESSPVMFVATTGTVTDANAAGTSTLSPGLPAGLAVGDVVFVYATIRNSGAGTVNTPANWSVVASSGNHALLARVYDGVWTMPAITFSGGVANATIGAKAFAFRSVSAVPSTTNAPGANASAQNVDYPAAAVTADRSLVIVLGWKQNTWTGVATLAGMVEQLDISIAVGSGAGMVIDYQIQTTAASIAAGSFVVTGGASAISRAMTVVLPHAPFLNEQIANIVPALDRVWLKSLVRPFLNRAVTVVGFSDPVRPARSTEFEVTSRTLPAAVNDVRSSRRWVVDLYVSNDADAQTLDYILAAGDVMLLQTPRGSDVPGGYVQIKDYGQRHPEGRVRGDSRIFSLPLVEVAPPGPDVAATIGTWASVLAGYATWDAVLAAFPTWADLLALHGDPSEVIVP